MYANRDPRRTPHQPVPVNSAPDAESETTASEGSPASDAERSHSDKSSANMEEMGPVERLEAFLQFIVTRARPDTDDVEQAEEAVWETIRELEMDEEVSGMAIAAALYEVLLTIEAEQRA